MSDSFPEDWSMSPFCLAGAVMRRLGVPQDEVECLELHGECDQYELLQGYMNPRLLENPAVRSPALARESKRFVKADMACAFYVLDMGACGSPKYGDKGRMDMVKNNAPLAYRLFRKYRDAMGAEQLLEFLFSEYPGLSDIKRTFCHVIFASIAKGEQ